MEVKILLALAVVAVMSFGFVFIMLSEPFDNFFYFGGLLVLIGGLTEAILSPLRKLI